MLTSMKEEGSFQLLGIPFYQRPELSQSLQGIAPADLAHTLHP